MRIHTGEKAYECELLEENQQKRKLENTPSHVSEYTIVAVLNRQILTLVLLNKLRYHPHFLIFSHSDYLIPVTAINSHTIWQTVQIQISWLLQKPADLDLHCLQRWGISGFSRTRVDFKALFKIAVNNFTILYHFSRN